MVTDNKLKSALSFVLTSHFATNKPDKQGLAGATELCKKAFRDLKPANLNEFDVTCILRVTDGTVIVQYNNLFAFICLCGKEIPTKKLPRLGTYTSDAGVYAFQEDGDKIKSIYHPLELLSK